MLLLIDDNPNCGAFERAFSEDGAPRPVRQVFVHRAMGGDWFDVAAVDETGAFGPASAIRVNDSSDGTAWLVTGGAWGVRLKPAAPATAWSLEDSTQRGEPFLLLDGAGSDLRFLEETTS